MPRTSMPSTAVHKLTADRKKNASIPPLHAAPNDVIAEVSKSNRLKALEEQYRKTSAEIDVKTGALDDELAHLRASTERFEQPYEASDAFRKYAPKTTTSETTTTMKNISAKKQRNNTITLGADDSAGGGGDAARAQDSSLAHPTATKVESSLLNAYSLTHNDDDGEESKDEIDLMFEYEDKLDQDALNKKRLANSAPKRDDKKQKPTKLSDLLKPSGTFSLDDENDENRTNEQKHTRSGKTDDAQKLTKLSNAQLRKIINTKTAEKSTLADKKSSKLNVNRASPVIVQRGRGKTQPHFGKHAEKAHENRNTDPFEQNLDTFDFEVNVDNTTDDVRRQAMTTKLHCLEEELKHEQKTLLHTEHELEQVQKRHDNLHKQAQHFETLSKKLTEQLQSYKTVADGHQASMQALEQRATQLHGDVEARERQMRLANTHSKDHDVRLNRLNEAHERLRGDLQQARAESDQIKQQLVQVGGGGGAGKSTLEAKAYEHRLRMLGETLRKMARVDDTLVQQQQLIAEQHVLAGVEKHLQELVEKIRADIKTK